MSYGAIIDFDRYFEGFATLYYGNNENLAGTVVIDTAKITDDLLTSFNKMNIMISSVGRIPLVPIGTNPKTGSYNPFLIEWNCSDTIFTKLKARHSIEYNGALPEWMMSFATRCNNILNDIQFNRIVLDTDRSRRGIGYPVPITKTGFATFYTNWDSGYYTRSDFPRSYRVKITGTSVGNSIGQAVYKISEDDGYSFDANEIVTGTQWNVFGYGLWWRWEAGTLTGTQKQLELNDEYQISCIPENIRSINSQASFRRFGRG